MSEGGYSKDISDYSNSYDTRGYVAISDSVKLGYGVLGFCGQKGPIPLV